MAIAIINTKFGRVFRADGCKDDYNNLKTSRYYYRGGVRFKKRPQPITLQEPALKAYQEVEKRLGFQVFVTGSKRECAQQLALWKSDPNRFAHPSVGVHTHGLAVDVDSTQLSKKGKNGKTVRETFRAVGWKQSRPDDEPWHHSWGVEA
jgi:hypothetical protein